MGWAGGVLGRFLKTENISEQHVIIIIIYYCGLQYFGIHVLEQN